MRRRFNLAGTLFLVALAIIWQLAAMASHSPNFPTFLAVIVAIRDNDVSLAVELGHTLERAGIGFLLALAFCLPLGIVVGRIKALGEVIEPVIELLRPLPPIAMVPVMMIFFGIGDAAKIAVVAYGASFPILINTIDAVRALDPMLSKVARALRLTRAERMRLVDLPAALPRIVAGVRISIALAVLLAVVAEMLLSTNGLGAFLVAAQQSFEIAKELAALLVIALVALAINFITLAIEHRILGWHHARVSGSAGSAHA